MAYINPPDLLTLGYDVASLPDAASQIAICERASAMADNFCYQKIGATTITERLPIIYNKFSSEINKIYQSYSPIISITSITHYRTLKQTEIVDPIYYDFDNTLKCIEINKNYCNKVDVAYTYGFDPIPVDVRYAVTLIASRLISDYIERKQTEYEQLKTMKDKNLELEFATGNNKDRIPDEAYKILMRYRRVR